LNTYNKIPRSLRLVNEDERRFLLELNEELKETGTYLAPGQINELIDARRYSLEGRGRLQWSMQLMNRLLALSAESRYIEKDTLAQTVAELFDAILQIQNSMDDFVSETDILSAVMRYFDHFCAGDLNLLRGSATDRIVKNYTLGRDLDYGYDDVIGLVDSFDLEADKPLEDPDIELPGPGDEPMLRKSFVIRGVKPVALSQDAQNALAAAKNDGKSREEALLLLVRSELMRFVGEDVSSVSEKTATQILSSIRYTISLCEDKAIRDKDVFLAFHEGQVRLSGLYKEALAIYEELLERSPKVPLDTFFGTFYREVRQFFLLYDPQYAAHECPCLMDYPTAIEVDEAPGIIYMHTYLRRLRIEIHTLSRTPYDLYAHLVEAYEQKYDMQIASFPLNFFEIWMHQALAASLALDAEGRLVQELFASDEQQSAESILAAWLRPKEAHEPILELLSAMSLSECHEALDRIARHLVRELSSEDDFAMYLGEIAERWVVLFESAILNRSARNLILFTPRNELSRSSEEEYFSEGEQMSDEDYTKLLEDLSSAEDTQAQARIIRERVRSAHDLLDLLREDLWMEGEKEAFLATLTDTEKELLLQIDSQAEPILGRDAT